jgi:hypothetical protein
MEANPINPTILQSIIPRRLRRLNNRCIIYEKPWQSSRVTASRPWKKPPPRFQGLEKSGRNFPVFGKFAEQGVF